ncbi:mandelate racemase/muconate lactonizing enzyme family protein [Pantoea sp. Ap-967]|uniref:mandelate racemase/muconate lactonizing enzyme family protein n=1 Tax=Pantoea sp. Ap-967 TaxID=2608362 RepID=UPI0014247966|nr:mandelate racemase/muconate lactonizing enzyme family protein [Pantoea sp. Ap-967]NIE73293.1 mandelate racemase/muconate lactonizing enzyme family protein [Pantoea sp. Ap-967]
MKIRSVQARIVEIPFKDGGSGQGITPTTWNMLETVLVRVEDTEGNVGWGESFAYFIADATCSVIDSLIKPMVEGTKVDSIEAWNQQIQRQLHLFGRYGVTLFAISGVDMALWDLYAKRVGKPLYKVLGQGERTRLSTYASLVRYNDARIAPQVCGLALDEGFTSLKLHEISMEPIEACHAATRGQVPISVDVNCSWSVADAHAHLQRLGQMGNISWLEEPIFPPEDFKALNSLRNATVPIAAGENWCTEQQFRQAIEARAVDYIQPSVTKVGGISEFLRVMHTADQHGIGVLPHSPYFGPGLLATLHLAAAFPQMMQVEYLYVEPDAWLIDLSPIRHGAEFTLSDQPGIGLEPDEAVIAKFLRP